jgi:hypothetical protein
MEGLEKTTEFFRRLCPNETSNKIPRLHETFVYSVNENGTTSQIDQNFQVQVTAAIVVESRAV